MNIKKSLIVFAALFFVITIWEHAAMEQKYLIKPTYFIDCATQYGRNIAEWIGDKIALICSFLNYLSDLLEFIKIKNYFLSIGNIIMSISNFITSWLWTFVGFFKHLCELTQYSRKLTVFGGVILACITIFSFNRFILKGNNIVTKFVKNLLGNNFLKGFILMSIVIFFFSIPFYFINYGRDEKSSMSVFIETQLDTLKSCFWK